jgi:hypothetical protein
LHSKQQDTVLVPRPTFVDFAKTLTTKGGAYHQSGHISKVVTFEIN